jgi:predicted ATP-binding protein involved in virulence
MSVPEDETERVKYKNFNIVLDEIELCFHPEYQKEFVNKLIGYLSRMTGKEEEKEKYFFNIILATHSPFILSDIPNCNIMYLEEGKQVNDKIHVEPFGANIHDILKQSFFLENGFIGEFAQRKIDEVITAINAKEINKDNYKEYKKIIDLIGEPLIKRKLMMMIGDVYNNIDDRIEMLEKEIQELQELKNK